MSKYPNGMFSWTDIGLPDQEAGKEFYGQVFGWTFSDEPIDVGGTYSMAMIDEMPVAAIFQQDPQQQQQGIPPMWQSYITVDDVDKAAARVTELGGNLIAEPFDVMDSGRMAIIQDPTGGIVSLWQATGSAGAGIFNVPGAMTWNELATRDVEAAKAFYSDLLGWEYKVTEGEQMTYHEIRNGDRSNGGMLEMDERWPQKVPTHWMVYFSVDDCDGCVETIKELGGGESVPPTDIPAGRFAVANDPQGGTFTVISYPEGAEITQPV